MHELKKILHIDDDEDVRIVTRIALELDDKFTVEQCASGGEALNIALDFSPDLFLLDVMMPGMSGEDTLLELRKIPEVTNVPTIFMTVKARDTEIDALIDCGAIAVITKPFDPLKLGLQISAIWARHHSKSV